MKQPFQNFSIEAQGTSFAPPNVQVNPPSSLNASPMQVPSTHDSVNYDILLQNRLLSQATQPLIQQDNLCDLEISNSSLLKAFDGIDFSADYYLFSDSALPMPILTAAELVPLVVFYEALRWPQSASGSTGICDYAEIRTRYVVQKQAC